MTAEERAKAVEHEQGNIRTYEQWKRGARKLSGPTPGDLAKFDQWMDRWISGCRERIARLSSTKAAD
jgi:hypothetical protein